MVKWMQLFTEVMNTMSLRHGAVSVIFSALLFCALSSCASNKDAFPKTADATLPAPPVLTTLPVVTFKGAGIKYEFESMLLYHYVVFPDPDASGQYATRMMDEASSAQVKVQFQPGTYECLVSEKAYDNDHAPFYVYLDNVPYRVYPSDPPLGSWELTTRVPIYFTLEEPRSILVTVQANSEKKLGSYGMDLDYIQFVKRQ